MEKAVTDLPEPDSPTNPMISPRPTVKLTPATALATPALVKKWVSRFSTARVGGSAMATLPLQPGVQHVAQLVADEVDGNDGD